MLVDSTFRITRSAIPILAVLAVSTAVAVARDEASVPAFAETRIVDAESGRPIPGARMSAVTEHSFPEPAVWKPLRTATADGNGFVRLHVEDLFTQPRGDYDWLLYEADGYAPRLECRTHPADEEALVRAVDVPVRVVDSLGRAAGDVRLGWILGCGHTPDIRRATTDAEGRATLRAVDPNHGELWTVGEGVRADGLSMPESWKPGDPEPVLVAERGDTIRGTIVHEDGTPAAGVLIGYPSRHRGPWTRTDESGGFVLHGMENDPVVVVIPDESKDGIRPDYAVTPHHPVLIRLPRPGEAPAEPGREIPVCFDVEDGLQEEDVFSITAVRRADGYTVRTTFHAGRGDFDPILRLPPGAYAIRSREIDGRVAPTEAELVVTDAIPETIQITTHRRATFTIEVDDRDMDTLEVFVVTPDFEASLDETQTSTIPWPDTGTVRLRIEGSRPHHVEFRTLDARPEETLVVVSPWRE